MVANDRTMGKLYEVALRESKLDNFFLSSFWENLQILEKINRKILYLTFINSSFLLRVIIGFRNFNRVSSLL